ncbi:MAG: endonuclease [Bacteroidales bacterium]|nr:endonuclease [Bacteroidales bacterium]
MIKYILSSFLVFTFILTGNRCYSQTVTESRGDIRVMFYNVENLFDVYDDTIKNDNEFLPDGEKKWTYSHFRQKTLNIYKTIAAVGEVSPPEIVCFAEIENRYVLNELIYKTPLEKYRYKIVHFDSPDLRGIDVGLIYRKEKIQFIDSRNIEVDLPFKYSRPTRDILYFKCLVDRSDTLHLFVNHWPSRMGGKAKSASKRNYAATVLRNSVDSILEFNSCAKILIMGDFNDEPWDESIQKHLGALNTFNEPSCADLYNLSSTGSNDVSGTYRYMAEWNFLDQCIVSGSLLNETGSLHTNADKFHIADFDFLLQDDNKFGGKKPFRTYIGPLYHGGFSDHLPVFVDLDL